MLLIMSSENTVRKISETAPFLNPFTQLKQMGINNPNEISGYALFQVEHEDILKIRYKRRKGSILPHSRKYKFGRTVKTIVTDSGKPSYQKLYEISPDLQQAVFELDQIIASKQDISNRRKTIIDEIDLLQQEFSSKLAELRSMVEELDRNGKGVF
jgi:hypothetical protein